MKTPFSGLWRAIRGDKYMIGAYPPASATPVQAAPGDAPEVPSRDEH